MEIVEDSTLLEYLFSRVHLMQYLTWIPRQNLQFGDLFWFQPLFLAFILGLYGLNHRFQEVRTLYLFTKSYEVRIAWIDSKHHWQFFFHMGPKNIELLFGQVQLKLVIGLKKQIILRYSGIGPLLFDFFVSALLGMEPFTSFAHVGDQLL